MASAEDKVPLLAAADANSTENIAKNNRTTLPFSKKNEEHRPLFSYSSETRADTILKVSSAFATTLEEQQPNLDKNIVCVFVVAFDIRAGNVVEWCLPQDCELNGIEFKAMASGSHRVNKDFIYFKKDNLFGFACFENMPVESAIERGARMKSVGILSTSYSHLHLHMGFLEEQVRELLQHPRKYDELCEFYEKWKAVIPLTPSLKNLQSLTYRNKYYADMKLTHPANCFSQFIKFFGEQIFLLWKFALLRKRILFFSPPPIGVVCYRVYCTSCLTLHNVAELPEKITQPLFYVNVADLDSIESHMHYIACTTEKIFEAKNHIYDVYADNQNVKAISPSLSKLMTISPADKEKFQQLNGRLRELTLFCMGSSEDDENMFVEYFTDLNNHLFRTLLDVSYSQHKYLTPDNLRSLGMDPSADRQFLLELIETYNIDVTLEEESSCCSILT